MAVEETFYQRYWLAPFELIPAVKLDSGRNQRDALSRGGICFVEHLGTIHEDQYKVRASRSLAFLQEPAESEVIYLTQQQFSQMIPWERSLEYYDTVELRELVRTHVVLVLGEPVLDEDSNSRPIAPSSSQKRFNPHGLPPVFVSSEALEQAHRDMRMAGETASSSRRGIWAWRQISWLRALLFMIQARQKKSWIPRWMKKLERIIKQTLEDPKSLLEKILSAWPIWRDEEQIGLRVRVDFLF